MLEFCTLLDNNFLLRGLALHRSLERQHVPYRLWILCADDASAEFLTERRLSSVHVLRMTELETAFPDFAATKPTRNPYEYIATAKPYLIAHVMKTLPSDQVLTYIDADTAFFGNPNGIIEELGDATILLTPHHFAEHLRSKEANGIFNAGFISVRNNDEGLRAMKWWCDRCREWCFDRIEGDKRSNQKYLEKFPSLFEGVKISDHRGLNLAPWNISRYEASSLIFFHFHGLKKIRSWLWDSGLPAYRMDGTKDIKKKILARYIADLEELSRAYHLHKNFSSIRTASHHQRISPGLLYSRISRRQWLVVLGGKVL